MVDVASTEDIYIEVTPSPGRAGDLGPADLVEKVSGRVSELGQALASLATQLRETMDRELTEPPGSRFPLSSLSLQMSINLEAEAGVVISRAKAGAAFQATLTWQREKS
jgi:hypothetical protein